MKQGWQTYTLGQVCDIARGGSPRPIKSYLTDDPNGIRWIKIGDTEVGGKYISSTKERIIKEGIKSSRYVKAGDFLLSNSMSFGRPYILKVDGCIHDGWLVIRDYDETFIQDFLYYLLLSPSVAKQFEDGARGSTVRNLNTDIVSAIKVNVPTKKSEQQRIVSLLNAEFAKIDTLKANAERNFQNAKDLFQAALKTELEPKEGWKTKHLNEIASYSIGLTYKPDNVNQNGTIVLRSSNIQNDELDLNDIVRVDCTIKEELYVRKGDILMCSRNGSRRLVGKVAKIGSTKERMTFGTFMTIIRSDYNPILFYFFKTKSFRNQLETGENPMINQITKYMLNDVVVSIPPSLTDQDTIVARLDALNEKCKAIQSNYEKTIALCDDLKQALLRRAFNGEL